MRRRLAEADWAMFVHPDRDCIYDEAQSSASMVKYRNLPIIPQVDSYRSTVPPRGGLYACTVIVRREPAAGRVQAVHDSWWAENLKWTFQDQLSLPFVLRRTGGPDPVAIEESLWKNRWFDLLPHASEA
jgi:hypothetical protein